MGTIRRSRHRVAAVAAAAVVLLGACGDDDSAGDAAPGSSTTAGSGSTSAAPTSAAATTTAPPSCTATEAGSQLTFGQGTPPRGLDPVIVGGGITGSIEVAALDDVLLRYEPESATWEPWLAKSLEPNADFSEWTLELRDGVKFANGDALTADAVKASIARHQDPANRSLMLSLAATIKETEVVDANTIVFHLDSPWTTFPYLLGGPVGMITNPVVVTAKGATFASDPNGGGAGPYTVERFAPGEELVLKARPDYWGGAPCIERLRFIYIAGGTATYEAFQRGELDAAFLNDAKSISTAVKDGHDTFGTLAGGASVMIMNSGYKGSTSPLQDVRLRRAVMQAIDSDLVDQRVTGGVGIPTRTILSDQSRYYNGAKGLPFDPAAAKATVDAVKAEGKWDGKVRLDCGAAASEQAITVEAMLKAAGFQVEVDTSWQGSTLTASIITDADYDIACWGINVTDEGVWPKLTRQLYSKGSSNYFGYVDPNMDSAIADLRAAEDEDEVIDALDDVQTAWNDTAPMAVLSSLEQTIVYSDEVKGLVFSQETVALFPTATIED